MGPEVSRAPSRGSLGDVVLHQLFRVARADVLFAHLADAGTIPVQLLVGVFAIYRLIVAAVLGWLLYTGTLS